MIIRPAKLDDAEPLSAVLNAVIAEGDKTAIDAPLSGSEFAEWFITGSHCISCVAAAGEDGRFLGFQALERFHRELPAGTADIATFVSAASRGSGVGRRLAEATVAIAERAGLRSLRAVIRRRNTGAISYYRSLGFRDEGGASTGESVTLMRPVRSVPGHPEPGSSS
ncbi:GNAT family N-acetyltransferase [Microlunatus parietis]|uniref:L-amino acid N-acyltransferase YncA n=1 Tax=Microlunatus parietis TaxID=682979 RepID=A0A7Y9I4L3_9ACTN|nr:GNAT family N-acetyltransferase [Microlunatus parietis]NYE69998.1 L-amino acid N-acyltransferase YncA [Microlunatus parietis]